MENRRRFGIRKSVKFWKSCESSGIQKLMTVLWYKKLWKIWDLRPNPGIPDPSFPFPEPDPNPTREAPYSKQLGWLSMIWKSIIFASQCANLHFWKWIIFFLIFELFSPILAFRLIYYFPSRFFSLSFRFLKIYFAHPCSSRAANVAAANVGTSEKAEAWWKGSKIFNLLKFLSKLVFLN